MIWVCGFGISVQGLGSPCRAKTDQSTTPHGLSPASQYQNLVLTVLYVPNSTADKLRTAMALSCLPQYPCSAPEAARRSEQTGQTVRRPVEKFMVQVVLFWDQGVLFRD